MANSRGTPGNLQPWKPGQSGNPGGRPKGRSLTSILREVLDGDKIGGAAMPEGRTVGQALVEAMIGYAIRGDAGLMKEILARADGKAPERSDDDLTRLSDAELLARVAGALGGGGPPGPDAPGG